MAAHIEERALVKEEEEGRPSAQKKKEDAGS
jgi:hypothetical protein